MADLESIVQGDDEPGGDGMLLTRLARRLQARIPMLCTLKTFYDGRENVPTMHVPSSLRSEASTDVYKRFVEICPMNLASTIANAVITNQQPTGFRLVKDQTMRSTAADDMWATCRMYLKSRQMFYDAGVYGAAYAYVTGVEYPSWIHILSPWNTFVSDDEDSAVVYSYSPDDGVERLTLFNMVRNDDGSPSSVYSHVAYRQTDARTIPSESDDEAVYGLANDPDDVNIAFSNDFQWETGIETGYKYAVACGCLPVVKMSTPTGKGQFEASIPTLKSIDQQRFQRFCIQEMQAFRQRAVSGDLPEYYDEDHPDVIAGRARAGDRINYDEIFEMGPAALWMMPKETSVWESAVTDVTPLVTAASSDIKQLAGATGTPLSVLSPDVAGSAEGARLTTRTLALKVQDLNMRANDAFVRILRMALVASGQSSAAEERFETTWQPVNLPTDLEQTQAANFVKNIIPVKTIMRRYLHMTESDIAEAMQDLEDESFVTALAAENRMLEDTTSNQYSTGISDPLMESGLLDGSQSSLTGGLEAGEALA